MTSTLYINGRFLTQPGTGVQRYAREIIANFDALLDNNELAQDVCLCCLVPRGTSYGTLWRNITIEEVGINHGNLWEQIDLPIYLKGGFLFSPANSGPVLYRNQAITFHDASVFATPNAYSFGFRLKHKMIFVRLAQLAKIIFTVSKFSQDELSRYLKHPSERFRVIHLAGGHMNRIQADLNVLRRHSLQKNGYILMVGSWGLRKNLAVLGKALELIRSDTRVVFAGEGHQKIFNRDAVRWTTRDILALGYITDEELKALYLNALGLILPSYYEGFGLPILEAMQCGCPVLCARAASLPEVAGEAALFFDPMDARDIAKTIDRIVLDPRLRNELAQKGYQRAKDFSWHKAASQTMRALLSAIKDKL